MQARPIPNGLPFREASHSIVHTENPSNATEMQELGYMKATNELNSFTIRSMSVIEEQSAVKENGLVGVLPMTFSISWGGFIEY